MDYLRLNHGKMKYNKIPFRAQEVDDNGNIFGDCHGLQIVSKDNQIIAEIPTVNEFTKMDAEYIVKACNEYPKLIDLLSRVKFALKPDSIYTALINNFLN